ncbi:hypothetical protein LWC34_08670 [Kibdelosporangium philippinense]|uniref:DUF3515 domain-containing protein n=1 Tax=Kibdelosporangium philippinense TaxID=211113 RepID=A0ABS8Z765_9PSEU|nr:hypothetical protein [Kibdelosporangium philippinense]MCE7002904.1 hypothetical protein [Kibdelosporangium philippinense]
MTARRLLLLLVAAVLVSLGVLVAKGSVPVTEVGHPAANVPSDRESDTETVALDQSVVHGIPPVRDVGRPAADPGLLKVQCRTEAQTAEPVLMPLGVQDEVVPLVSRDAVLLVADGRAPPVRQVVA